MKKYCYPPIVIFLIVVAAATAQNLTNSRVDLKHDSGAVSSASINDTMKSYGNTSLQTRNDTTITRVIRDTVYVVDKPPAPRFTLRFKDRLALLKEQKKGLSAGPAYGIAVVNIKPVKELLASDPFLRTLNFSFNEKINYETFFLSGGSIFIRFGNDIRLGATGMHGTKQYSSNVYTKDSVINLSIETSFGGFLIERAAARNRWTWYGGCVLGGGSLKAWAQRGTQTSMTNTFQTTDVNKKEANVMVIEAHGGATFSFFPIFHVGISVSAPGFISPEGFGGFTNDFYSVNPVVALKILFGNLG